MFGTLVVQKKLFDVVAKPLVEDLIRGKNGKLELFLFSVCYCAVSSIAVISCVPRFLGLCREEHGYLVCSGAVVLQLP